ncbi:MAG: hypothetical protein CL811_01180 [Colwelliaceae bacterium]|nr:hypothetical protein [Colwelliaceae bacterium]
MKKLEIKNLTKSYENNLVLSNLSLEIEKGSFTVIVGPSGCGKTTLLKCISGVESQEKGRIFLDNTDITNDPPERRNISMVWQNLALFSHLNVYDNIEFGLGLKEKNSKKKEEIISNLMKLTGLEKYKEKFPSKLSGGEKQRVAIARALAINPEVILLDEPFSSLDAKIAIILKNEIKSLQKKLGITFIMVTHNIAEAFMLADKIIIMNNGKIEQVGKPEEIYKSKNNFVSKFIGHQVSVEVFRGIGGMKLIFEDMLNYPICRFIAGGAGGGVSSHMPKYWKEYNKRRVEKKILWQDLLAKKVFFPNYDKHRDDKKYLKEKEYYDFRVMPKEIKHSPHVIFLYGEKIVNVIWAKEPLAFMTENKHVFENHLEYFKYLWERSK